jgi:hypothetical protein
MARSNIHDESAIRTSIGRNRDAPLDAYQEHGFLGGKGAPW